MTQIALSKSARADIPQADRLRDDYTHEVAPDVAYQRIGIVNVVYVGQRGAGPGKWVLIDAGLPGTAPLIQRAAEARFAFDAPPACIIMTHAHADHAGALEALAEEWQVPIFACELECPYLDGTASYPAPDIGVGGGAMPALSALFPRGPLNVSRWLLPLPKDHSVPAMPGWKWIHTRGHTPGHISLWRESDRTLIVGDAFVTTDQESVYAVLTQKCEMHGPPTFYTQNWSQAEASVKTLAALGPEVVVSGHGHAMRGFRMRQALNALAQDFDLVAVPENSLYLDHPVIAENGTAYIHR
jgi:glyoxylase-like metal-dependent hydrolase (beta-lactamase superfamily II)